MRRVQGQVSRLFRRVIQPWTVAPEVPTSRANSERFMRNSTTMFSSERFLYRCRFIIGQPRTQVIGNQMPGIVLTYKHFLILLSAASHLVSFKFGRRRRPRRVPCRYMADALWPRLLAELRQCFRRRRDALCGIKPPLQGFVGLLGDNPRALPWAGLNHPFGGMALT
jgi:hypothetical protein